MKKTEKALKKLEIINHWLSNCDSKCSMVLAFYSVIVTIIFSTGIGSEMLKTFTYRYSNTCDFISIKLFISLLLSLAFFFSVIITLIHIYKTLKGNININAHKEKKLNTNSNIFFNSIVNKNFETFEYISNNENKSEFLNDINSQVFINSKIVSYKFKHYNRSLFWALFTFIIFILFILMR